MAYTYDFGSIDDSVEDVLNEDKMWGFERSKPLNYDNRYEELYHELLNDYDISEKLIIPGFGKVNKNYISQSIKLWKALGINLHDINYCYSHNSLFHIYSITKASPFDMPIRLKKTKLDSDWRAYVVSGISSDGDFADSTCFFTKVILPKVNNGIAASYYSHELTHTQFNPHSGVITRNLYCEIIPYIIEQLFAYYIDFETFKILRYQNLKQLRNLLGYLDKNVSLSYYDRVKLDKYIVAILVSNRIVNEYVNGNTSLRNEIIDSINKLFNEELSVAEMLSRYDANLESVSKDIMYLKKLPL